MSTSSEVTFGTTYLANPLLHDQTTTSDFTKNWKNTLNIYDIFPISQYAVQLPFRI